MPTQKIDTRGKVVIQKSRSKKQPFRVAFIGKNGEVIGDPETFTTKRNVEKNIVAHINFFAGTEVTVLDLTGKNPVEYVLMKDGFKDTRGKHDDVVE